MAARDRRSLALTFAAAMVLVLAAAVIAGQVLGGHLGRRPVAMIGALPAAATNPAPLPSPLPHRPG